MEYKFQVNLGGIIDLLSNHIYSSPQVFIRELLQNAVDAITARTHMDAAHEGRVWIELPAPEGSEPPTLVFRDNGIGLTEDEIHGFLATIGQTSKRDELVGGRSDYIGQFGIGLLSCFVVSDEIVVLTRSAAEGAGGTTEWRGYSDGTYSIRSVDDEMEAGTEVRLRSKAGSESYFDAKEVARLAHHYGSLLPYPISLTTPRGTSLVNEEEPPWKQEFAAAEFERDAYLDYGRKSFGMDFLDYVPLRSSVGDVRGVAFVLPQAMSLASRKTHRVYLKNMLLSEDAEGLLPEWAFFVKCVVNADDLRPTASRESFYEDEALQVTRQALGRCLRNYLVEMAERSPQRLKNLIALHYISIKALAAEDDEFFRIFVNWLPFETNMGTMTLTEYRKEHETVHFALDMDEFRQISRVAASQSLCVINAAYAYDPQLLLKFQDIFPETVFRKIDAGNLSHNFEFLTLYEQEEIAAFVEAAEEVLSPYRCSVEVRKFSPVDLPALYTAGNEASFRRSVEISKEVTDSFWSSVLDRLDDTSREQSDGHLCFNYRNPLFYKVSRMQDERLQRLSIQVLYVQSLLLGHRPLTSKEMKLMNEGLLGLVEWGADIIEGGVQ
ncbi:MAG TPA: HSP90 family protein [Pyrinomonadaceae bacterium]|nr:HSP90 family protein [Pyrinomonadaceae bacterium]